MSAERRASARRGEDEAVRAPRLRTISRAKGTQWNVGSGLLLLLVNFLVIPMSIGVAGRAAFGAWAISASLIQLMTQADLGLGSAVVQKLAFIRQSGGDLRRERELSAVAGLLFTIVGLVVSGVAFTLLTVYYDAAGGALDSRILTSYLWMSSGATALSVLSRYLAAVLQSYGRFDLDRVAVLAGQSVRFTLLALQLQLGRGGALGIALADVLGLVVTFLILLVITLRSRAVGLPGLTRRVFVRDMRELLGFSIPVFVSSLATLAAMQTPLYLAGLLLGFDEAAGVAALVRIYQSARTIIGWVTAPALPVAARLFARHDRRGLRELHAQTLALSAGLSGLLGGIGLAGGTAGMSLWLGAEFSRFGPALGVLTVAAAIHGFYAPGVVVAAGAGHPGVAARYNVALLILGLLASWWGAVSSGMLGLVGGTLLAVITVFPFSSRAVCARTRLPIARFYRIVAVVGGPPLAFGLTCAGVLAVVPASAVVELAIAGSVMGSVGLAYAWVLRTPSLRERVVASREVNGEGQVA